MFCSFGNTATSSALPSFGNIGGGAATTTPAFGATSTAALAFGTTTSTGFSGFGVGGGLNTLAQAASQQQPAATQQPGIIKFGGGGATIAPTLPFGLSPPAPATKTPGTEFNLNRMAWELSSVYTYRSTTSFSPLQQSGFGGFGSGTSTTGAPPAYSSFGAPPSYAAHSGAPPSGFFGAAATPATQTAAPPFSAVGTAPPFQHAPLSFSSFGTAAPQAIVPWSGAAAPPCSSFGTSAPANPEWPER